MIALPIFLSGGVYQQINDVSEYLNLEPKTKH
jgi:hypothetical protein